MKSGSDIYILGENVIDDTTQARLTANQTVYYRFKDLSGGSDIEYTAGAAKTLTYDSETGNYVLANADFTAPTENHIYQGKIYDTGAGNMRDIQVAFQVDPIITASSGTIEANVTEIDGTAVESGSGYIYARNEDGNKIADATIVNVQVDDVINTDANADLTTTPAANASLGDKIKFLFAAGRNERISTSSVEQVKDDSGTVISEAAVTKTDSQITRGEFGNP